MGSTLLLAPVEKLQDRINEMVSSFQDTNSVYISLNKTYKNVEELLRKAGIKTDKIFFIDCAAKEKTSERALHIPAKELDKLSYAIKTFIKKLPGKKSLLIDSLSTLLIYNSENQVAAFAREITEYASQKNVEIIAISPKTEGEELLNKIFNFFTQVIGK